MQSKRATDEWMSTFLILVCFIYMRNFIFVKQFLGRVGEDVKDNKLRVSRVYNGQSRKDCEPHDISMSVSPLLE